MSYSFLLNPPPRVTPADDAVTQWLWEEEGEGGDETSSARRLFPPEKEEKKPLAQKKKSSMLLGLIANVHKSISEFKLWEPDSRAPPPPPWLRSARLLRLGREEEEG